MKNLVVLACICAAAYAQSLFSENLESSTVYSPYKYESASNLDNSEQTTPFYIYYDGQNAVVDDNAEAVTTGSVTSERRGRYQSIRDQEIEGSAPRVVGPTTCKEKNERYAVPGSCDKYIECLNGTAEEKQCPDGLRYNPNVKFNVYPCQYPIDVPCLARSALQPAQPTDACPHQFGYFKTGDARNCSGFRNCVNGVGYDFTCPEGLAFSSETYRCEWPDEVADCDVEAFLGFRCPEIPISKELGPPVGFRTYRSPSDCQKYFLCIDGKPRRLTCGGYSAFDELTESCVAADEVADCPTELRNEAKKSRDAEKQRLTAQAAFEKLRFAPKNTYEYATTQEPFFDPGQDNIENETQTPQPLIY
ncbi:protein obstructor-E-like [Melitaea cinxia]|uniref:protein obstructor-E-like n=1 Tax=Melitaea cinxia TaxID=113334 RepID=UPI001E27403C|nr:protein obstructor-E-like [Melitaea cinxia]